MQAQQAVKQFHKVFASKLEGLVKTTIMSLAKTKELVDALRKDFIIYKQPPYDFARLVDYENNQRIVIIRLLSFLLEHEKDYNYGKSFNENMKELHDIDDTLVVPVEENKEYLRELLELHKSNKLTDFIKRGISYFDKIYSMEINQ